MPEQPLSSLGKSLLRAGVAPRYVRRYVAELSDHYESLERDELAAGFGPEQARRRTIGAPVELLTRRSSLPEERNS